MWNILPQHQRSTLLWGLLNFKDAVRPQPCDEYLSLCDTWCLELEPVFLLGQPSFESRRWWNCSSTLCEQPIKTWRQTTVPSGIGIQMQQVNTHPDLCFHNQFVFSLVFRFWLFSYNLDLKMTTIMTPMVLFLLFLSLTAIPPVSLTSSCFLGVFCIVNCLIFQPTLKIKK